MTNIESWIYGLLSAALSGGANAIVTLNLPGVHSDNQWSTIFSSVAIGAIIGVANFLIKSPLAPASKKEDDATK
jgi:hypothetical protein